MSIISDYLFTQAINDKIAAINFIDENYDYLVDKISAAVSSNVLRNLANRGAADGAINYAKWLKNSQAFDNYLRLPRSKMNPKAIVNMEKQLGSRAGTAMKYELDNPEAAKLIQSSLGNGEALGDILGRTTPYQRSWMGMGLGVRGPRGKLPG